ncbi:hypothetical protein HJFPF1_07952 [Paramyrothecium foliicola]|nr:hypothetical protein HJFPF1_07952 [Paramyrothecium foliicola]
MPGRTTKRNGNNLDRNGPYEHPAHESQGDIMKREPLSNLKPRDIRDGMKAKETVNILKETLRNCIPKNPNTTSNEPGKASDLSL